ncbi:MAG: DUF4230 domain-containing protein [Clostridiales bacterium]|nr:DUF4230 domain-containing protein [Clostridiales bacterium]
MRKVFKRVFLVVLLMAILMALSLVSFRYSPTFRSFLLQNGSAKWLSQRFSETIREKNELVVFEAELTGQETYTENAMLLGTVQKVEMPYTFVINFSVDLSKAVVSPDEENNTLIVSVPAPYVSYYKLTVNESEMKKTDWLLPLTPERYAELHSHLETRLCDESKNNPEYLANAWNRTVNVLETQFKSLIQSNPMAETYTIQVIQSDALQQTDDSSAPSVVPIDQ